MLGRPRTVPPAVYLLADHLDAVLAAGEDLLNLSLKTMPQAAEASRGGWQLRRFVASATRLECSIAMRALQARQRARELGRAADQFKPLATLFASGTTPLQDAVDDLADASASDFDSADDPIAYLRSRAVLDEEAAGLPEGGTLAITGDFLVAGRIALGPLLDLAGTFLDAIDTHYDLYEEEGPGAAPAVDMPAAELSPGP
jgi:hypothetical protein